VEAIVRDYHSAGLEPAEVALMAFVEKVVLHAYEVTQEDIDNLRTHGFSDADILDIALTAASKCLVSKVIDALGLEVDSKILKQREESLGEEAYQTLQVGRVYSQAD
jgi:alkylhydroperoxidase family enzyme